MKRILIATVMGLICGFICYGLASGGPAPVPAVLAWSIITSRTLIGFAIGISRIKIYHWSLHGIVMGFIFSVPSGLGAMMANNPDFSPLNMLVATIVMGMIYGLLIELVTTVVFKAKQ